MTQTPEQPSAADAPSGLSKVWRWIKRGALGTAVVLGVLLAIGLAQAWVPMGGAPSPERAARMAKSPNSKDGIFVNKQALWNDVWGSIASIFEKSPVSAPDGPLPVATDTAERLAKPPQTPLRVTWLGHSTVLFELDGKRIVTDPIFGRAPFPVPALGPQRWYEPPLALEKLQDVDAVLISHDHYDHLDHPTIAQMSQWDTTFITPLGVGAHLEYWGVDPSKIIELDWWDEHKIGPVRIVATPSRHASGRHLTDQNRTLWASYAILGSERRVMFSGDTGLHDDMRTIGERFGPFDLVMIEVGAYHKTWPDWHIGPEQAIVGHQMMKGKLFVPIHWGLFDLASHGWTEPIERVWVAAEKAKATFATPRPGQVMDIDAPPQPERWWPDVPWKTAQEDPLISTLGGDPNKRYAPTP